MKRAAPLLLLLMPLLGFGQTVSYWFQGWQRKPDARQAQEYFMVPGANVAFTYATNHVIINAVGGGGLFQLTGDVLGGSGVAVPTTLAVIGGGGVNTKITFDTKGRVTGSAAAQLASADFANQGTTTTVLHGNAAGNPSWAGVSSADLTGTFPFWGTSGNALGGSTFFLGSTDNQPFSLKVNNTVVATFNTDKSINLNSSGASIHMDGPVYSGNTINETNAAVIPYTHPAPSNVGIAAGQMPMACFAFLSLSNAQNINISSTGVYSAITNFNLALTNHFHTLRTNGIVRNEFAGYYRISISVTMSTPGANDAVDADVLHNGTACEWIASHTTVPNGVGKFVNVCASGILHLTAGTSIAIGVTDTVNTGNLNILHAQLTVGTP